MGNTKGLKFRIGFRLISFLGLIHRVPRTKVGRNAVYETVPINWTRNVSLLVMLCDNFLLMFQTGP